MFFCLAEWLYLTKFNERHVLLDLVQDKYIMLEEEYSTVLTFLLNHKFALNRDGEPEVITEVRLPSKFQEISKEFIDAGYVNLSKVPFKKKSCAKANILPLTGAAIVDWKIPLWSLEQKAYFKDIVIAFLMLIKFQFILRFRGMFYMIKRLQKIASNAKNVEFATDIEKLNRLVVALNRTCLYFPKQIKCLEWSYCLVSMALQRRIKCNLVIGLQLPPFIAHAWVEINDNVIADSPTLPDELAIILREPFAKS
jgi:hypothetical protein